MDQSKQHSRQNAIALTHSTSSRLAYLDRVGLVVPQKIGVGRGKRPLILYSDRQIDQIKLINQASVYLNLDAMRCAIARNKLPEVVKALTAILHRMD